MVDTEVSKSSASRLAGSSPALGTTITQHVTNMKFQLDNLITEYESLEQELADPTIYADLKRLKSTNQKKKSLEKTVILYQDYKRIYANYEEAKTLVTNEKDPDMLEMMKTEISEAEKKIPELEEALKLRHALQG